MFVADLSVVSRKDDPSNDREILDFTCLNKFIIIHECKLLTMADLMRVVRLFKYGASLARADSQLYCSDQWKGIQSCTIWYCLC